MSILARIHQADPGTFDPNTPQGPAVGEVVALASAGTDIGIVVQGPGGPGDKFVGVLAQLVSVVMTPASGGVLTTDLTITVEDLAGSPREGAIVMVAIDASVALTSVAAGGAGFVLAATLTGDQALVMAETDGAGVAIVRVIASGAGSGSATAVVQFFGMARTAAVPWTF